MGDRKIRLGLGVDLSDLSASLDTAASRIEELGRHAVISPRAEIQLDGLEGNAVEESASALRDQIHALGGHISGGLSKAIAGSDSRIAGLMAHLDVMSDRMSGTMIELAERIDSAMKWPWWNERFTKMKASLSGFGNAAIGGLAQIKEQAAQLPPILASMTQGVTTSADRFTRAGKAAREARDAMRELFARKPAKLPDPPTTRKALREAGGGTVAGVSTMIPLKEYVPPKRKRKKKEEEDKSNGPGWKAAGPIYWPTGRVNVSTNDGPNRLRAAFSLASATIRGTALATGILAETVVKSTARSLGVFTGFIHGIARVKNFMGGLGSVSSKTFSDLYAKSGIVVRGLVGIASTIARVSGLTVLSRPFVAGGQAAVRMVRGVANVRGAMSTLGRVASSTGSQIAAAFGFVGILYKGISFIRNGVKNASDLNEAVSATGQTFGASSNAITAQADAMAKAFGIPKKAQLDAANAFGGIAQGAGMSGKASADLANQFTKLAGDASSFFNVGFEESSDTIRSALTGQGESLKKWGVSLTEESVKAQALAMGLGTVARSGRGSNVVLDEGAKIQARAALIMQGLGRAHGDLERTQDSAANQFRKAGGGIEAFGVQIGQLLLPAINLGTQAFNDFLGVTLDVFQAALPTIQSWMGVVTSGMAEVGKWARNAGAYFQIAKLQVGQWGAYLVDWFSLIPTNFGIVVNYIGGNWDRLLKDLWNMSTTAFSNLIENAKNFGIALWKALRGEGSLGDFEWKPLLTGFKATADKFPGLAKPAMADISNEIAEIMRGVNKKEEERAKSMAKSKADAAAAAASKPDIVTPAKTAETKAGEPKLASAAEFNSAEAYKTLALNSVTDRKTSEIASNTRATARAAQEQVQLLKAAKPTAAQPTVAVGSF